MALLDIRDLSVRIGDRPILADVSLSVGAGEVLALVGGSGAGKSMTALAAAGLLPPQARVSGQVLFDGRDLAGAPDAVMRQVRGKDIGLVFQEPATALNPVMTIGDQTAEVVRLHQGAARAEARAAACAALERVGLPPARFPLDLYPHELSGGQRQRVAIAIATALTPRLLIADEPTASLDVTTQAQILALLTRLAREDGMGLILITHDLAVAAETADRLAVMQDGRVVETGAAGRRIRQLRHPYSRQLLADAQHRPRRAARPATDGEPVVRVEGLVREYPGPPRLFGPRGGVRAVDGVDLTIRPGESVGLVGESGCGKSTLLRALLGLETPQAGRVLIGGQDIHRARGDTLKAARRRIQAVFQDPYGGFDPRWPAHRLIAEPLRLLEPRPDPAEARRRVDKMLERVGLAAADGDRFAHQFSGGQRQRIAIARALITRPQVVALDEAVSALDVSTRARILDLLAELSDQLGVAYLFVTHDLGVARTMTDRLLVMQSGRIVEAGDTAQVFASPRHPYSQALLAAAPVLETAPNPEETPR